MYSRSVTHVAFEINNRAAVERQLANENISITETVVLPDGTVFFFIRDPDGSVIKFYQPSAGLGLSMAESDSQQLFEFSSTSIGRV